MNSKTIHQHWLNRPCDEAGIETLYDASELNYDNAWNTGVNRFMEINTCKNMARSQENRIIPYTTFTSLVLSGKVTLPKQRSTMTDLTGVIVISVCYISILPALTFTTYEDMIIL